LGAYAAARAGRPAKESSPPTQAAAERMIVAAEGGLAPVYAPLAAEIAEKLDLGKLEGVGIDLGSGPGTLILHLCRHTKLHWINADINPHFFPYFLRRAKESGLSGRVSAIRADACRLPFRRNLAAVIVSRGSFHFWPDLKKGLAEVHRVLKPEGVAYIGRGFPERLPPEIAKEVRSNQGGGPKYDVDETEQKLRQIMEELKVDDFRIHRPRPEKPEGVNYGLWLEFRKTGR
jgi:SAM-dependent methyltransferase